MLLIKTWCCFFCSSRWLGFEWDGTERYASDYFGQLYEWAEAEKSVVVHRFLLNLLGFEKIISANKAMPLPGIYRNRIGLRRRTECRGHWIWKNNSGQDQHLNHFSEQMLKKRVFILLRQMLEVDPSVSGDFRISRLCDKAQPDWGEFIIFQAPPVKARKGQPLQEPAQR